MLFIFKQNIYIYLLTKEEKYPAGQDNKFHSLFKYKVVCLSKEKPFKITDV